MNRFTWQHIEFEDGSNPYICTTEKEFERIRNKYNLVTIKQNFWIVKNKQNKRNEDLFYNDLLMEQQEQM